MMNSKTRSIRSAILLMMAAVCSYENLKTSPESNAFCANEALLIA